MPLVAKFFFRQSTRVFVRDLPGHDYTKFQPNDTQMVPNAPHKRCVLKVCQHVITKINVRINTIKKFNASTALVFLGEAGPSKFPFCH